MSKALNQGKPDAADVQVYLSDQQQQYAAGECDQTTSLYYSGLSSDERGRGRLGSIETGGGGHYTTSAAMGHTSGYSTDELSRGSNGNNNNIGIATSRPNSKGKTYCVDKDYQSLAANENSLSPPSSSRSGSGSGSGTAQQHSPHRGKVPGSTQSTPPTSSRKTGFITAISAAAAAALSPPSSTSSSSSSSSSLTSKPQQTMAMSTGGQRNGARAGDGGGGGEGGGVLLEIEEGSEKVATSYLQDDGYSSLAATDRPPPLPARPIGEVSPRDRTSRSSLYSLHGPEFLTVMVAQGQHFGGRNHNRTNSDSFNDKNKSNNNNNKNGSYGNNGGNGMLQLPEIGYDLGLSLSELENPDGSIRTPIFVDSHQHLQQKQQQQQQQKQQKQNAPHATTTSLSSSVPSRHGLGLDLGLGVEEGQRGDMYSSPPPSLLSMMTHPLDLTGQSLLGLGLRNGGGEGGGSGSEGAGCVGGEGSSSLSNKKHHTVLGAGRAAVNGVLCKFRKSIG